MSHWDTSFNSAVAALMAECSKRELSRVMAIEKLQRRLDAQVPFTEIERAVSKLVEEGYISDGRFAAAFTRDKLNFSGWGPKKIEEKLIEAGVSKELIKSVLEQENSLVNKALEKLLLQKGKELKKRYQKKEVQYSQQLEELQQSFDEQNIEEESEVCDYRRVQKMRAAMQRKIYALRSKLNTIEAQRNSALVAFALRRGFPTNLIKSKIAELCISSANHLFTNK